MNSLRPSSRSANQRFQHRKWKRCLWSSGFLLLIGVRVTSPVRADNDELAVGAELYTEHCTVCHGEEGDGNGPAANRLRNKPRDFRPGIFKFRSTPSGSLPLDADLFRTLTRGIPGTAMLPQTQLTERERWAVIRYLQEFSPRFRREKPVPPIATLAPTDLRARVERGRQLYYTGAIQSAGQSEPH